MSSEKTPKNKVKILSNQFELDNIKIIQNNNVQLKIDNSNISGEYIKKNNN